jgi:hypothetical protein
VEIWDMVIEPSDAVSVLKTIAGHLIDVSRNEQNFKRLPDIFWGYFARGHDNRDRKFGVIFTYSEREKDIDELIKMYEQWVINQDSEKK